MPRNWKDATATTGDFIVQKLIIQLYVLVDHILFWSVEAKYILICFFENM